MQLARDAIAKATGQNPSGNAELDLAQFRDWVAEHLDTLDKLYSQQGPTSACFADFCRQQWEGKRVSKSNNFGYGKND